MAERPDDSGRTEPEKYSRVAPCPSFDAHDARCFEEAPTFLLSQKFLETSRSVCSIRVTALSLHKGRSGTIHGTPDLGWCAGDRGFVTQAEPGWVDSVLHVSR